jgi:F420-dependent oxidoreductase-like protein
MRLGVMFDNGKPIDDVVEQVRQLRDFGFDAAWSSQIFGADALTLLAVVGREVPDITLGTAVVPTYPRHPMMLAAQALTVQAAIGGRLALGIGLSHQMVIEGMFGYSFEKPARHMREYLSALLPLLQEGRVQFKGETLAATGQIQVPGSTPPVVLVAALAPQMLRLAGGRTDGTITWMTGPKTIAEHIVPSLTKAASNAGRTAPRVVVGLPVCVDADADSARSLAGRSFQIYGQLPSYRAMLDREGAEGPADVAIVGDEDAVARQITALADGGATDLVAAPFGSADQRERTLKLLASLL